ncbi:MAG: YcxB family protein [Actinobacteria bacterium]|nr:YcxB family protein [Actinomycetota bacterium]
MGRLEYTLTNDDYVAFNRYAAKSSPMILAQSHRIRTTGTLAAAVMAAVVFWFLSREPFTALLMTAAAAGVMWFIWPAIQRRAVNVQLNQLARAGDLGRLGETVLTWDERGITEAATASQAVVGWERVRRVEESGQHLYVFTGDLEALIVPKRAGAGVAELARFTQGKLAAG